MSGSTLRQFEDYWQNFQRALLALVRGSRAFWAGAILCLLFPFVAEPALAQIAADATVVKDNTSSSTTITAPAFSTAGANELVLAFVATDYKSGTNTTVKSIAGGSLTWTLVRRTNAQSGTAEIWRAFATAPLTGATV